MQYKVFMAGTAMVSTSITIEAKSEEEAVNKALETADCGDVVWNYQGIMDEFPIEVTGVRGGQDD